MSRRAYIAGLAAVAVIAGCGSSSSSSSSSAGGSPSATSAAPSSASSSAPASSGGASSQLTLSESEFKISPATPVVAHPGAITITVKNTGKVTHALAVQTPSGVARTRDIAPGQTATLTVNITKAGHYTFFCPIDSHRQLGMQGMLTVGSAGAPGATGGAGISGSSASSTSSSSSSVSGY